MERNEQWANHRLKMAVRANATPEEIEHRGMVERTYGELSALVTRFRMGEEIDARRVMDLGVDISLAIDSAQVAHVKAEQRELVTA